MSIREKKIKVITRTHISLCYLSPCGRQTPRRPCDPPSWSPWFCVIPSLWVLVGAVTGFQPTEYRKDARCHSCNYTPPACRLSLTFLLTFNNQSAMLWTSYRVGHLVGPKHEGGLHWDPRRNPDISQSNSCNGRIPMTWASLNVDPSLVEPPDENTAQRTTWPAPLWDLSRGGPS